ncbi:unnamed protein product, partial [Mesorhabditis belari]|uniref:RRM domain-containing protein n=1 Tax=Mesorhabditis belari TaxID=2138241 RepID=A0AAF3EFV6_9BILA
MNPITNIKNQNKLNERELALGIAGDLSKSWHKTYKNSAWVYVGGLPYELSEGDLITVFSQWGEVININMVRDRKTGKSKGFCFLCYQDQRSTVLAVDNMNGITLLKRILRVDHVDEYKVPKYREDADEETKRLWEEGCAPKPIYIPPPDEEALKRKEEEKKKYFEKVAPLGKLDDEMKKARKDLKKKKRKEKKEKRRSKRRMKKEKKLAALDPEGDWKSKQKLMDKLVDDKDLYGVNEHFNFGKKIEEKDEKVFNARPDFEKADYRTIEIWKIIREQEKAEKIKRGESILPFEEGAAYLPSRFKRDG